MLKSSLTFAMLLFACGGGSSSAPPPVNSNASASSNGNSGSAPSAKADQCHALAARIDTFIADAAKLNMQNPQDLASLQTLATQAGSDVGAIHADDPVAGIVSDSATHLTEAAKVFGKLSEILTNVQTATAKLTPDSVNAMKACVVTPVKAIATYCKAHPSDDCTQVRSAIDTWGAADKHHEMAALHGVTSLVVTDKTVKARHAEVVTCVKPLSDVFTQLESEKAKLSGVGDAEDAREKQIDERFAATCGRKLFNK